MDTKSFTRYDYLSGKQLKDEFTKRFGSNTGSAKLPLNRNQAKWKYRLLLAEDDLKHNINPYLPRSSETEGKVLIASTA